MEIALGRETVKAKCAATETGPAKVLATETNPATGIDLGKEIARATCAAMVKAREDRAREIPATSMTGRLRN